MNQNTQAEFDNPWKEAVEYYFKDFMAFFFPMMHDEIDWSRGYEFLDKELEKIVRDAQSGRRYADKLVRVFLANGNEARLMIHIEIQGWRDSDFAQRMYIYHYRIFDRYHIETVSIAVLTDNNPNYRPNEYQTSRWGCELTFRFPIAKVWDYMANWDELAQNLNPFAMVVMAHLKALETKNGLNRKQWKLRLIRMLYDRGYKRADVLELFRFIDWLLILPGELDKLFWQELHQIEEEKKMPYVTSVERIGIEKGIQQGIRQGSLTEAREMVLQALKVRFGAVPPDVEMAIKQIEVNETLKELHSRAILCDSLETFEQQLTRPDSDAVEH